MQRAWGSLGPRVERCLAGDGRHEVGVETDLDASLVDGQMQAAHAYRRKMHAPTSLSICSVRVHTMLTPHSLISDASLARTRSRVHPCSRISHRRRHSIKDHNSTRYVDHAYTF